MACPRYHGDTLPCKFNVRYQQFQMKEIPPTVREEAHDEWYSYLIFKKGKKKRKLSVLTSKLPFDLML